MTFCAARWFSISLIHIVILSFLMSLTAYGQTPIVTGAELREAIVNSAKVREENLDQVRKWFSTDLGRKALTLANLKSDRIEKAVSMLNAEELARLAMQTRQIQSDFAGGALTNQQITYILIALGTAVVVLVLTH